MTVAQIEYESTPEFQDYLLALGAWTNHKSHYAGPDEQWYDVERDLYAYMYRLLKVCRSLPQHLTAFGW